MPTIEERVSTLEQEMAGLQGQLSSDMRHIDGRFDDINKTFRDLFAELRTVNDNIASINTTGQLANQSSSTNEKLIWVLGAFITGILSFVAGKVL